MPPEDSPPPGGHELICTWLGLPRDSWPPDHYRLLGLEPGEGDLALIEQRVNQRLDSVRPYQMMHPEPATEVMNRLAQAFICLTEPAAKRAYDEQLLGVRPRAVPPPLPPPRPAAACPRPARRGAGRRCRWSRATRSPGWGRPSPTAAGAACPPSCPPIRARRRRRRPRRRRSRPSVPSYAAARSPVARRGLSTRRGLYRRVCATRHLQRLWHRMGEYLDDPERRFSGTDARELYRLVEQVGAAADEFPLLGDLGQPGHYILNLGQLDRSRDAPQPHPRPARAAAHRLAVRPRRSSRPTATSSATRSRRPPARAGSAASATSSTPRSATTPWSPTSSSAGSWPSPSPAAAGAWSSLVVARCTGPPPTPGTTVTLAPDPPSLSDARTFPR